MSVKLLSEHHLEFLSLKGDCTGLSESILVEIPHCWKSHVTAHMGLDARKPVFGGLQPTQAQTVCAFAQSDQRLFIRILESKITKLATSEISFF